MSGTSKPCLIDLLANHLVEQSASMVEIPRERLLAAILCGDVLVAGERCREPKRRFPANSSIVIASTSSLTDLMQDQAARAQSQPMDQPSGPPPRPFVSRGGDKLESVLGDWAVPVAGRVWLDAGSSTGGFTHCLLLRGASLVHAVDVGYNLLDWRLRVLPQIRLHERTNIMALTALEPPPQAAVADLSFRSMAGAAARILALTTDNELYGLIKPQFERKYGLERVESAASELDGKIDGFKGVVADTGIKAILIDVVRRLAVEGIRLERLAPAGLKGRTGNQEYVALLRFGGMDMAASLPDEGTKLVDKLF